MMNRPTMQPDPADATGLPKLTTPWLLNFLSAWQAADAANRQDRSCERVLPEECVGWA
jgi:hypothetical protein